MAIRTDMSSESEKIIEKVCVGGFDSGYGEVKGGKCYVGKLRSLITAKAGCAASEMWETVAFAPYCVILNTNAIACALTSCL